MNVNQPEWETTEVRKVHVCNICEDLFHVGDAEYARGYSKAINDHLCMPCQDAVAFLRSKKKAKFVR